MRGLVQETHGDSVSRGAVSQEEDLYSRVLQGMTEIQRNYTMLPVNPVPGRVAGGVFAPTHTPSLLPLTHDHFINYGGMSVSVCVEVYHSMHACV